MVRDEEVRQKFVGWGAKPAGPDAAKELLGIPAERRARTLVTIGHTDVEARRALPRAPQARKPMSEFAHWDRY